VVAVRKFREQPRWQFIPGADRGYWQLSALCEVRGAGELPTGSPGAAPELLSIGWIDPIADPFSPFTVAHSNTGTGVWAFHGPRFAAAVVDYDEGGAPEVEWTLDWTPVVADPDPTIYQTGPSGRWVFIEFSPPTDGGLLRLTATVGGQPTDAVIFTVGAGSYADLAWGPEP